MSYTNSNDVKKRFYIMTVDILQGISVFLMVMGHTGLWWDPELDFKWPNVPFVLWALWTMALVVPPGFLFWYAFNTVNSLLRRTEKAERIDSRSRLIKRTVIFFIIAEIGELVAGLVTSPKHWLNFLFTWELFHMFALTSCFFLLIFELAWVVESYIQLNYKNIVIIALSAILIFILSFFLIFHDYSRTQRFNLYVDLNIRSIIQRMIFEEGQSPIIPWLAFPIIGGILATFLDLPNTKKEIILKKASIALTGGLIALIVGILFLGVEKYISTPSFLPASTTLVFIAISFHILSTTGFILILDLNSLHIRQEINQWFLPVVLLSQITLTVYIVHNIAFAIPSDNPFIRSLLFTADTVVIAGFLYSLVFVFIAFLWEKRDFKFSIEWILWRLQRAQWRWRTNKKQL